MLEYITQILTYSYSPVKYIKEASFQPFFLQKKGQVTGNLPPFRVHDIPRALSARCVMISKSGIILNYLSLFFLLLARIYVIAAMPLPIRNMLAGSGFVIVEIPAPPTGGSKPPPPARLSPAAELPNKKDPKEATPTPHPINVGSVAIKAKILNFDVFIFISFFSISTQRKSGYL